MFETMNGFECDKWKENALSQMKILQLHWLSLYSLLFILLSYSIHLYSLPILPFLSLLFFTYSYTFSSLLLSFFFSSLFSSFSFSFLLLCFCSAYFFHISDHSFLSSCPRIGLNILFIISRNKNNCRITLNKINIIKNN